MRAANAVREREQYCFLSYLLVEFQVWEAVAKAWDSKKVDRINEVYLDEIVPEDFENSSMVSLQAYGISTSDVDSLHTLSKKWQMIC